MIYQNSAEKTLLKLMRVYKLFLREPNRVFIKKDLANILNNRNYHGIKQYITCLKEFNIIEEVDVIYNTNYPKRKGYKLRGKYESEKRMS